MTEEVEESGIVVRPSHELTAGSLFAERTLAARSSRALQSSARIRFVGPGHYGSIGDALDDSNDGDTVAIQPGLYVEVVWIERPLTILGQGDRRAIVIRPPHGEDVEVWSPARISNLTFEGATLGITDEGAGSVLEGLDVGGADFNGVQVEGDRVVLRDSFIHNCDTGIHVSGGADVVVERNELVENTHGVFVVDSDDAPVYRLTLRGNKIHDGDTGIWILSARSSLMVENEIFRNETGVSLSKGEYELQRNVIRENETAATFWDDARVTMVDNNITGPVNDWSQPDE